MRIGASGMLLLLVTSPASGCFFHHLLSSSAQGSRTMAGQTIRVSLAFAFFRATMALKVFPSPISKLSM